jgi:hypothetical protein
MHELAALFFHHTADATTRNNLAVLRHYNPGVPIIPLSNSGVLLPGGYDSRKMIGGWRKLLPSFRGKGFAGAWDRWHMRLPRQWVWRNVDLMAYLWIAWPRRPVRAKRWAIIEWDICATQPLSTWYADNWNDPMSSTFIQTPGRHDFHHFNEAELARMPADLRPWLIGANPWAGSFFSDEALNAIAGSVRNTSWCNGFCEIRGATVANSLGMTPVAFRNPQASQTLRSMTNFTPADIDRPGLWHRVKQHDPVVLDAGWR